MLIPMEGEIHGKGALKHTEETINHNLTENSLLVVRAMMIGVFAEEFFKNGKVEVFANDLVIEDEPTGRKFSFTLTAKEI